MKVFYNAKVIHVHHTFMAQQSFSSKGITMQHHGRK